MPSSHVYADLSAGFFRYRVSDGSHSHIHIVHTLFATINNTVDPGSPADADHLINPELDVNATARNFMTFLPGLLPTGYTAVLMDFVKVLAGFPVPPPFALLPYTVAGGNGGPAIPEAEVSYTFRDLEGAPCRFVQFGGGSQYNPTVRPQLTVDWAGTSQQEFVAYVTGVARAGGIVYPANMTHVCSHNGQRLITPLNVVSGLNNRLRREYRVK